MKNDSSIDPQKSVLRKGSLNVPIQNTLENKLVFQNWQPGQVKRFPVFAENPQTKTPKVNESSDLPQDTPQKITGLQFAREKILEPSNAQPLGFGVKKVGANTTSKIRRGSHDFITTPDNQMYASQMFPNQKKGTLKLGLDALARPVGKQSDGETDSPVKRFKPTVINTKNLQPPDEPFKRAVNLNFGAKEQSLGLNSPARITNNLNYIRRPVISTSFRSEADEQQLHSPLLHPEDVFSTLKKTAEHNHHNMVSSQAKEQIEFPKPNQKNIKSAVGPTMPTLIFRKKIVPEESKCISARLRTCQQFSDSYSPTKFRFKRLCLQDFMIGKKLGKGKYGDVFAVKHKQLGFVCAMKVISKALIRQQNIEDQFVRELKIQCFLTHANVTTMYGYFYDVDNVYLLMEICYDGHLMKVLKVRERGRLPEEEAKEIIRQICKGLQYIHRQKVLHRDIKPENIIIHQGLYKLCDFGWARYAPNEMTQTFCGSPLYVSPEILKGQLYNAKIDIWSIGVLTYEMLFGKPPFKINTPEELSRIITDEITFPEFVEVSVEAKDFIARILKKNPEQRCDIDQILDHPFVRCNQKSENLIAFNLNL